MSTKIIKRALLGTAALSAAGLSIVQTSAVHADVNVDKNQSNNNNQTQNAQEVSQTDVSQNGGGTNSLNTESAARSTPLTRQTETTSNSKDSGPNTNTLTVNKLQRPIVSPKALTESKLKENNQTISQAKTVTTKLYIGVNSNDDYNTSHELHDITSSSWNSNGLINVSANAVLNSTDIHKGATIKLFTAKNSDNDNLGVNNHWMSIGRDNKLTAVLKDGTVIGDVIAKQTDNNTIQFLLNVTTDKSFVGDISVTLRGTLLQYGEPAVMAQNLTNITRDHPLKETITVDGSSPITFTYNLPEFKELKDTTKSWTEMTVMSQWGVPGYNVLYPHLDDSLNDNTILTTSSNNLKFKNFHRVMQETGSNLNQDLQYYVPRPVEGNIYVVDKNNKITTEALDTGYYRYDTKRIVLSDNLTPQQVYDQTPAGSFAISKQNDGSFIIGMNYRPTDMALTDQQIKDLINKNSLIANVVDPQDKQTIINNTINFYHKLNNVPSNMLLAFDTNQPNTTSVLATDVTPSSTNANAISNKSASGMRFWGNANANGQEQRFIMYQFVDDDNNGLAVGQPVTLTGKTGDVVNPHLLVPAGYELAPGQSLPGNYTLKDSNTPVIIHLKHKTGSAVVNTPASQTDEDTSSTPATKANDDSNKQNDQSNNNQQEQPKNDDQHQNKSKNNSDKIVLADKNNKDNSVDDSQKQKVSSTDNQPQETAVKATKTASQSPTIVQSQLPQTDSNDNNSAAMLGTAALTGSFAAMFAMNKHRKED